VSFEGRMKFHGRYMSLTSNVEWSLIPVWHFLSTWCIFWQEKKQMAVSLSSAIGQSTLLITSANISTKERKIGWLSICRVQSNRLSKYFRKSYHRQSRGRRQVTPWLWQSPTRLHKVPSRKTVDIVKHSLKHALQEGLLSSLSGLLIGACSSGPLK
jgi:hypothetical protein